jgi:hypothetical protein
MNYNKFFFILIGIYALLGISGTIFIVWLVIKLLIFFGVI